MEKQFQTFERKTEECCDTNAVVKQTEARSINHIHVKLETIKRSTYCGHGKFIRTLNAITQNRGMLKYTIMYK